MPKINSKLISIIVPCFNSGKTLKRTILSIKNQTWKFKEIIIVNDGSTDSYTLEIINDLSRAKLVKIITQKNKGLAAARNIGAKLAKGNYLFFLDSDDWIDTKTLEEIYSFSLLQNKKTYVFPDIKMEGMRKGFIKKEYNFFEQLFFNQLPYCLFISKRFLKYL